MSSTGSGGVAAWLLHISTPPNEAVNRALPGFTASAIDPPTVGRSQYPQQLIIT